MSAATRMVTVSEIQVPVKDLLRVLVVDDERTVRETQKEHLERMGYRVDVAEDPDSAKDLVERNNYQVIIADVVFDKCDIEGDRFILDNEALFGDATKVIITGKELERIQRLDELRRKGVPILEKGKPLFDDELEKLVRDKLEVEKGNLFARIRESVPSILETKKAKADLPKGGMILADKAQEILLNWLKTRKDPDRKGIFLAGREFSPNMLVDEIKNGSQVGIAYVDMFLDLIKHNLGL